MTGSRLSPALASAAAAVLLAASGCGGASGSAHPPAATPQPRVASPIPIADALEIPKPAYLSPIRLPSGEVLTRITGDPGTAFSVGGSAAAGAWGPGPRHHYSLDEPWNSDGTLIALQNAKSSPTRVYLDAATLAVKYASCPAQKVGDDRWNPSPQHPAERIEVTPDGSTLQWFDVRTCQTTRQWHLPFAVKGIGLDKGNPSDDGSLLLLADASSMFMVDMSAWPAVRIGPRTSMTAGCNWSCVPANATVSPSGRHAVVGYEGDARRVYDVDRETLALTPHRLPSSAVWRGCQGTVDQGFLIGIGHADLATDPFTGDEVIVGQNNVCARRAIIAGRPAGSVILAHLADGDVQSVSDASGEATAWFVSCRNVARPGWCYVTYRGDRPGSRFNGEIVAMRLDGGAVTEIASTRTITGANPYDDQPHAVPSRNGQAVIFASDWERGCGEGCGKPDNTAAYLVTTG